MRRPQVNDPSSTSSKFRKKRFRLIEDIIEELARHKPVVSILDVGGRGAYWDLMRPDLFRKTRITVLNLESELPGGGESTGDDGRDIRYRVGDGCAMPEFADRSFDLVHSNSVIEHVGSLQNMTRFADETCRVGNAYYVQTPYLGFPIEPHYGVPFVHWLPAPCRARLLSRVKLGYAGGRMDYRAALAAADHTQIVDKTLMRRLFPDGALMRERFALMTKSLVMIRRPGFG